MCPGARGFSFRSDVIWFGLRVAWACATANSSSSSLPKQFILIGGSILFWKGLSGGAF